MTHSWKDKGNHNNGQWTMGDSDIYTPWDTCFLFLLPSPFFLLILFCALVWSVVSIVLFLLFPVLFSVLFAEIWMWRPARDYPNDPNITYSRSCCFKAELLL